MRYHKPASFAILAVALAAAARFVFAAEGTTLGQPVPDFTLKNPATGAAIQFADFRKGPDGTTVPVVVAFWSFKCPTGAGAMGRFKELAAAVEKRGARLLAVCSYGEPADKIAAYAKENGIAYPLGVDEGAKAAVLFDAKVVTATYVVDKDGKLVYKGGLGDGAKAWPEAALDDLAAGKPVARAETKAYG